MSGINIHITVTNEYLKKNNIKDRKKFKKEIYIQIYV